MSTLKVFFGSIKTTLTNISALVVFGVLYALLLLSFFRFIWIREATLSQVFFTYSFMILIPLLFFIYQAAIIDRVLDGKFRWRVIMIDAIKFLVLTIPVLLIGWLLYYLLNKIAIRYPAPVIQLLPTQAAPKPQPLHWPSLIFATVRFMLFGVVLPLTTIHLWIATAGGEVRSHFSVGAQAVARRVGIAISRAFAADSVLLYALGLIVFFVLPYAALWVPFTPKGNKTDFTVFVIRLLLTFIFSLIGWVVTISALTRSAIETAPAAAVAVPQTPVEAAA